MGEVCAICLESMVDQIESEGELTRLSCQHIYHTTCLAQCRAQWKNHCPLCRKTWNGRRVVTNTGSAAGLFEEPQMLEQHYALSAKAHGGHKKSSETANEKEAEEA